LVAAYLNFFYQLNNVRFSSFLLGRGLVPGPIENGRKKTGPARAPGPTKKAGRASHRAAPIRAALARRTPLAGPGHVRPGAPLQTRTKSQRKGRRSRRSEVSLPSPAINQQTECVPDLALFIPWPPVPFFNW